jgi:hypothetical protein
MKERSLKSAVIRRAKRSGPRTALIVRGCGSEMQWLASASERTGVSQNVLTLTAVGELRRVLELVDSAEADGDDPVGLVELIGSGWSSALVSAGVASERLRAGFRQWEIERDRELAELRAEKAEREAGKKSRGA